MLGEKSTSVTTAGERERGEEEESGVGDARHGGEKWRRVLRKVAAGARAFRSGTFSEVF